MIGLVWERAATTPTQRRNSSANYARQKRCGGGDREGIRKAKYAMPRLKAGGMYATARLRHAGREMGTKNASELGSRYDLALSLEVAGEEAPFGPDHNLATGIRAEGTAGPR
jgi:hypothetical protein